MNSGYMNTHIYVHTYIFLFGRVGLCCDKSSYIYKHALDCSIKKPHTTHALHLFAKNQVGMHMYTYQLSTHVYMNASKKKIIFIRVYICENVHIYL